MRAHVEFSFYCALFCFVQHVTSQVLLSQQCWHERILQSVNLFTFADGYTQAVEKLDGPIIIPTSPSTYPSLHQPDTDNHSPWTHPPICTPRLPSINSKLCIYTNTSFSNNRGISIFTTPALAHSFANLPAFKDPTVFTSNSINTPSNAWKTSHLPNRGIGMLASRPLVFKDRVTAYTPAFLAFLETDLATAEREKYWRAAVQRLPTKTREMYEGLATLYGVESVKYQDVVKANAFQVEVRGGNHLALFPETSRFNHDCAPNAQYIIDPDLLTHFVHVTRPIKEGEEITIAYTSPLDATPHRQSHLQNAFHFKCTCARCTSSSTDTTLATIASYQTSLNDWSPSSAASPAMAEQLLNLYRQEGLEGFMDVPYGFASLAYSGVGDEAMARKFAERAREACLLKDARGVSQGLGIWEGMLEEGVEKHWSWRRRA